MSSPYNDTGRPATLTLGGGPVLLTPGAGGDPPLVIVNTSKDRAWIAGDSTVSSNNGVPLDPGTSLPWTGTGEVWGVADDAATAPIVVYITSAVSGWTPSPAAIASQVAAELLATGIPNVLTETVVADQVSIPAGNSQDFDVSGYASVVVNVSDTASYEFIVNAPLAGEVLLDQDAFSLGITGGTPIRLAVVGPILRVFNHAAFGLDCTIVGSNRPAFERYDARSNIQQVQTYATNVGNVLAGGKAGMALTTSQSPNLQGLCYADIRIWSSTIAGQLLWPSLNGGDDLLLTDTTEMVTATLQLLPSGGTVTGKRIMKLLSIPVGFVGTAPYFWCSTGGSFPNPANGIHINLVPAGGL